MWLRGEPVTIRLERSGDRQFARYGDRAVAVPAGIDDLRAYIHRDLRQLARDELGARLGELAAEHSLTVSAVTIRNQRSRWGSCSRTGRIALNFRLVQMPPFVSDYVLVHELMHLKQQNHSRRFWRLVEAACPRFREAEAWLAAHGRGLL
jgi:predicted metal-dependent hydrolase